MSEEHPARRWTEFVLGQVSELPLSECDTTWLGHARLCFDHMVDREDPAPHPVTDKDGRYWSSYSDPAITNELERVSPPSIVGHLTHRLYYLCVGSSSWQDAWRKPAFKDFVFYAERLVDNDMLRSMWALTMGVS